MGLTQSEISDLAARAETLLFDSDIEVTVHDLLEALFCLNKIIENSSPVAYYYFLRGKTKFRLNESGDWSLAANGAVEDISKAIELDPDQANYYHQRGLIRYGLFRFNRMLETGRESALRLSYNDLKIALSKDPIEPSVWLSCMAFALLLNDWDETISIYGQSKPYVSNKSDRLIRAWLGCLTLIMAGDSFTEEDIHPLMETENIFGHYYFEDVIRHLYITNQKIMTETIRSKINELVELLIKHITDEILIERIYHVLGLHQKALETVIELLKKKPRYPLAWNNIAYTLEDLGRYEEALYAINRLKTIAPDYPIASAFKANLLHKAGRNGEALIAFSIAMLSKNFRESVMISFTETKSKRNFAKFGWISLGIAILILSYFLVPVVFLLGIFLLPFQKHLKNDLSFFDGIE